MNIFSILKIFNVDEKFKLCVDAINLFSAIARPGNSRGPIVSNDGYIVGIVSKAVSSINETALPFYAGVPTSEIIKALQEIDENIVLPLESYE